MNTRKAIVVIPGWAKLRSEALLQLNSGTRPMHVKPYRSDPFTIDGQYTFHLEVYPYAEFGTFNAFLVFPEVDKLIGGGEIVTDVTFCCAKVETKTMRGAVFRYGDKADQGVFNLGFYIDVSVLEAQEMEIEVTFGIISASLTPTETICDNCGYHIVRDHTFECDHNVCRSCAFARIGLDGRQCSCDLCYRMIEDKKCPVCVRMEAEEAKDG